LQEELKKADPAFFSRADIHNPKRVLKALEVYHQTGKPYSSFLTGSAKERPFRILKIALDVPRVELFDRINARTDAMMQEGLEAEARSLYPFRHLNALNTVGYKELFGFFDGSYDREEAVRLIKRNTRRYARRQLTWFRNDQDYFWFSSTDPEAISQFIDNQRNDIHE
jgi:tRNA dimethylallyltransferase